MNTKLKKGLIIAGLCVDVAVTIFLFVIAIIMLSTMPKDEASMRLAVESNGPFIGYLQQHPTLYFCSCVLPLFVLLAANIIFLVLYVRKVGKKPEVAVEDLNEEQKAALRAELLKELQGESKDNEKQDETKE